MNIYKKTRRRTASASSSACGSFRSIDNYNAPTNERRYSNIIINHDNVLHGIVQQVKKSFICRFLYVCPACFYACYGARYPSSTNNHRCTERQTLAFFLDQARTTATNLPATLLPLPPLLSSLLSHLSNQERIQSIIRRARDAVDGRNARATAFLHVTRTTTILARHEKRGKRRWSCKTDGNHTSISR